MINWIYLIKCSTFKWSGGPGSILKIVSIVFYWSTVCNMACFYLEQRHLLVYSSSFALSYLTVSSKVKSLFKISYGWSQKNPISWNSVPLLHSRGISQLWARFSCCHSIWNVWRGNGAIFSKFKCILWWPISKDPKLVTGSWTAQCQGLRQRACSTSLHCRPESDVRIDCFGQTIHHCVEITKESPLTVNKGVRSYGIRGWAEWARIKLAVVQPVGRWQCLDDEDS